MFFINKGETMKLIRNILMVILFIELLIYLYVNVIHKKITSKTTSQTISKPLLSKNIISIPIKKLPISSEYTEWSDEKIAILNKKIELFNQELVPKKEESRKEESMKEESRQANKPTSKKFVIPSKKIIKIAKQTKVIPPQIKKITKKTKSTHKISIREKIAKYAKAKLGKKYVWGAVGPRSFDCSGFTRAIYKSTTGIKIPRVSRDQAKVGRYVKYKGLKCGDMVFFDTEKKFSGKVNHVGIYLSNGNFIHASSARKKVIITNFNKKPFYKKRFLWGRRVVNKQS